MRHLAQPLLVDIVTSLADEARYESPLPLAPRALPPSASADALADEDRRGKT